MMDAVERTVRDAVQRLSLDLRQLSINVCKKECVWSPPSNNDM